MVYSGVERILEPLRVLSSKSMAVFVCRKMYELGKIIRFKCGKKRVGIGLGRVVNMNVKVTRYDKFRGKTAKKI